MINSAVSESFNHRKERSSAFCIKATVEFNTVRNVFFYLSANLPHQPQVRIVMGTENTHGNFAHLLLNCGLAPFKVYYTQACEQFQKFEDLIDLMYIELKHCAVMITNKQMNI